LIDPVIIFASTWADHPNNQASMGFKAQKKCGTCLYNKESTTVQGNSFLFTSLATVLEFRIQNAEPGTQNMLITDHPSSFSASFFLLRTSPWQADHGLRFTAHRSFSLASLHTHLVYHNIIFSGENSPIEYAGTKATHSTAGGDMKSSLST